MIITSSFALISISSSRVLSGSGYHCAATNYGTIGKIAQSIDRTLAYDQARLEFKINFRREIFRSECHEVFHRAMTTLYVLNIPYTHGPGCMYIPGHVNGPPIYPGHLQFVHPTAAT